MLITYSVQIVIAIMTLKNDVQKQIIKHGMAGIHSIRRGGVDCTQSRKVCLEIAA